MSVIDAIGGFFKGFGALLKKAFAYAVAKGLTDELVKTALVWARVAERKFVTSPEKRQFVIQILVARGVPESVARIALELAIQLLKKELGDTEPS